MELFDKINFWTILVITAVIGSLNVIIAICNSLSEKLGNENAGKVSAFSGKAVGFLGKVLEFLVAKK